MKKIIPFIALLFISSSMFAQLIVPPSGGNKKAMVGERIGITDVTIHYDRPGVKGREGKIWGALIPPGYNYLGFGPAKEAPWRAGANENTTIEFSTDVLINGQNLPAGKYGFFVAYDPNECTLIFSKNNNSWGSYFYDQKEDALRVQTKPVALDANQEWLEYIFTNQKENSVEVDLNWEKLQIPFTIEVDLNATQLASFRNELRTEKGFTWESWDQAASWCLNKNINLDQALIWSDTATSQTFGGDREFTALSTKAKILKKLGRNSAADVIMKNALAFANEFQLHQYGIELLKDKRLNEAMEIFKMNYTAHPNNFAAIMGMARVNSAKGNYNDALKYVNDALKIAPNENSKKLLESMIDKLKNKQDIN